MLKPGEIMVQKVIGTRSTGLEHFVCCHPVRLWISDPVSASGQEVSIEDWELVDRENDEQGLAFG